MGTYCIYHGGSPNQEGDEFCEEAPEGDEFECEMEDDGLDEIWTEDDLDDDKIRQNEFRTMMNEIEAGRA